MTLSRNWDILSIESGATGRRFAPVRYKEVTASLRDGRLLLFICKDLNDQSEKRNDEGTKLKQLGPCNHAAHPLFFRIGGKEDYPRGGEPPTVTGSTIHRIAQKSVEIKSRPSHDDGRLLSYSGFIAGNIPHNLKDVLCLHGCQLFQFLHQFPGF